MKSLFIIGNGFDLVHGLKTSYDDFHKFIKSNPCIYPFEYYNSIYGKNLTLSFLNFIKEPQLYGYEDNFCEGGSERVVSILEELISAAEPNGDKWSDLERILGSLDYSSHINDDSFLWDDEYDGFLLDDEYEGKYKEVYRNYDMATLLAERVCKITNHLSHWINSIKVESVLSLNSFIDLIDINNDLFITFNYTETLEYLYKVKNICHIHGKVGEKLLFGHGNSNIYNDYLGEGIDDVMQELHDALKKDTRSAIRNNMDFFDKLTLSSIEKIYSFGFSFSKVDQVYIKTICDKLQTNKIIWFLNEFDSCHQRNIYKNIIRSCGFHGNFDTYAI